MWIRACAVCIAGFLGLHALYWLPPFPLPLALASILGWVLLVEIYFFLALGVVAAVSMAALIALLGLSSLIAPRTRHWIGGWLTTPSGRQKWAFRGWLHGAGWTTLLLGHLGLDTEPRMTWICISGAALLGADFWAKARASSDRPAVRRAILVLYSMAALWWIREDGAAAVIAVAVWSILLFLLAQRLRIWLPLRDRFLIALLAIPVVQGIAAFLPLWVPVHEGRELGGDMAYSFCEAPAEHRLFVAVPGCSASQPDKCREEGRIDEFDARTLELLTSHRFFSSRFTGRLEQLTCLDDRVQVGMDFTIVDGEERAQSLLEFPLKDPGNFTPNALGDGSGDGVAYDRRRGRVFYRSERDRIIRRDLGTGSLDRSFGRGLVGFPPIADIMAFAKRDSLIVMGFYGTLLELDLETLSEKGRYPILNGWELLVDEELDRVYVAGSWGLEVVDLRSGGVVRRLRAGLGARRPAIDRRNQRLYVPSTAAGRLQIYDRRTLEFLGALPLGVGVRLPFVSEEHGYVLASSAFAYYSWRADELARRYVE
jgi:hypothetical protein